MVKMANFDVGADGTEHLQLPASGFGQSSEVVFKHLLKQYSRQRVVVGADIVGESPFVVRGRLCSEF